MYAARGMRNNNPGNIRHGIDWIGDEPGEARADSDFERFDTMALGIRALLKLLQTYRKKHGLKTVRGIVSRWAPRSENDTAAYIRHVAEQLGVGPDEELGDGVAAYLALAKGIARHECGPEADLITVADWEAGARLAFNVPPPAELQPPAAVSIFQPASLADIVTGKDPAMPAPAVLAPLIGAAATTLFDVVADLFRGHGSKTAVRNAEIIEAVGPVLVDVAKTVTGEASIDGATERVLTDPDARTAFRQAVEQDLDKLVGMVERLTRIEDDSRDRAAARAVREAHDLAPRMASEQFWLVAAVGLVIGIVAIVDVWKDGAMTEGVMALLAGFAVWAQQKRGTVVDYRFGSSASSQMKDEVIAAARK